MRKLTEPEIKLLQEIKYQPGGDMLYWEMLEKIYKGDKEVLEKVDFLKKYLIGLDSIPHEYHAYEKTQQTYLNAVSDFNKEIGYIEPKEDEKFEDNFLEMVAAKIGLDVDINGDGFTSMQKYGKK